MSPRKLKSSIHPVRSAGLVSVTIAAFSAGLARAETASEAPIEVQFEYAAPEGCLEEARAFELVRSRSRRVSRSSSAAEALRLSMRVSKEGRGFRGILSVIRPGEQGERRSVSGANCSEVVEALALTAALSIDPEATIELGTGDGAPSADRDERATALPPDVAPPSSEEVGEHEPPEGSVRFLLSPLFSMQQLMTSGVHLGSGLRFALSDRGPRIAFPLELTLSAFGLFDTSNTLEPNIRTSFVLGHVAYCPLRFGVKYSLLVCPSTQLGMVTAESRGFGAATSTNRFFATVGLDAMFRVALSSDVVLWVEPAVDVPLTRRAFAVDPGPEVIARSVDVGFRGWVGLGWAP